MSFWQSPAAISANVDHKRQSSPDEASAGPVRPGVRSGRWSRSSNRERCWPAPRRSPR